MKVHAHDRGPRRAGGGAQHLFDMDGIAQAVAIRPVHDQVGDQVQAGTGGMGHHARLSNGWPQCARAASAAITPR